MNQESSTFKKYESYVAHFFTILGLLVVIYQLNQTNEHKRWENFNGLNIRYYEWYSNIPKNLNKGICSPFEKQNEKVQKWVRTYFNLYSEEYWLYLNDLIPKEMWEVRINNGVNVNLVTYPQLVKGYKFWKEKGAFVHPKGFIGLVDKKLILLKDKLNILNCEKTKKISNK